MAEPRVHLLDALASIEEQRRYVIAGTVEEYLVPDEILNDARHFCELAEQPENSAHLTRDQRAAISRLREALDRLGACTNLYDRSNIADLIERDRCWEVMRSRAGEALSSFGHTVPG